MQYYMIETYRNEDYTMDTIRELMNKYKSFILYAFFGVCTTIVNILAYAVCTRFFHLDTISSTIIAWILAVVFAYVTNRTMVFDSKAEGVSAILREIISFFSCRLLTGGLDLLLMYIFVDIIGIYDIIMKVISNIIVIILNYVASKWIIFKSGGQNEQKV